MLGIIFATQTEANSFLNLCKAVQLDDGPITIYQIPSRPNLVVAISGMGKVAASVACHAMIRELKVSEILNTGACGALISGARYRPGTLFSITSVMEGDHALMGKEPQALISDGETEWDLPPARLVTCDMPVFDTAKRKTLSAKGELVDMEGAAIARVAAMYQIPWTMVKGVTDSAGPLDRATLKANLAMVSNKIGQLLWKELE